MAIVVSLGGIPDVSGQVPIRPILVQPHGRAKPARGDTDSAADDAGQSVFPPADRTTLKKLAEARRLLGEGRVGEAVRNLGAILDESEDHFLQTDKGSPVCHGLRAEAQRLIGQMPREGRELYELQYGARARQMLDEALATGDVARIAEVARRFFHTRSGYQATFLLAEHYFEHGRPLAAALVLQRLQELGPAAEQFEPNLSLTAAACWLQAGMPEKARETLTALRERRPTLRVSVGGREVPIFTDDAKAVEWLAGLIGPQRAAGPATADGWLMFRGDVARNCAGRRRCAVVERGAGASLPPMIPWRPARWRNTRKPMPRKGVRSFPRCTPWPSATCC